MKTKTERAPSSSASESPEYDSGADTSGTISVDADEGLDKEDEEELNRQMVSLDLRRIKHPLKHSWTFWYLKPMNGVRWEDCLKKIHDVRTIEDFWAVYHCIERVSTFATGCDYSLFKTGITPMWEDRSNRFGGRWIIDLSSEMRTVQLDNFWLEVLLYLIGSQTTDGDELVNGAVVSLRSKLDRIGIWLNVSDNRYADRILNVGAYLKDQLAISSRTQIIFEKHDSLKKRGSMPLKQFTI